jgi:hypothetical protein
MCRYGIQRVRQGHYAGLRFDLFGRAEQAKVEAFMARVAPDIPFSCRTLHF